MKRQGKTRKTWEMTSILLFLPLAIMVLISACGSSGQFNAGAIYEARAQMSVAKRSGAEELAQAEFQEASRILSEAEEAISKKREKEAYKLGYIAYLKARLAEAVAIRNKAEREADIEEAEFSSAEVELNKSRQERKSVEEELENFSKE